MERRFEGGRLTLANQSEGVTAAFTRESGLIRVSRILARAIGVDAIPVYATANSDNFARMTEKAGAEEAVDLWLTNYAMVSAWSPEFDFLPMFSFQPALSKDTKPWHVSEQAISMRAERGLRSIVAMYRDMSEILI